MAAGRPSAYHLGALGRRIPSEVWNIQGHRGPETDHACKRRDEETQKFPHVLELAWRLEHGTHTTGFARHPEQEQQPDNQHEWCADALEKLDGFDPAPNDKHIHRPEEKKANPRARWQARGARPDDSQHRVNGLTADPRLDTEPAASHESSQNRRYVRPAHTERSANENRERNAVLGTRVRIQNHWNKHDQVAEQNCADGLIPIHPAGN